MAVAGVLAALWCGEPAAPRVAAGDAGREYFPLVQGATWVYHVDLGLGSSEVEFFAEGVRAIRGLEQPAFVILERTTGESFGLAQVAPSAYVISEGFVSRYSGVDFDDAGGIRLLGGEDPTWVLPVAGEPGRQWAQETRLFEQPEGGGGLIRWTGRTENVARVQVPAGIFTDVLKVRAEYWDTSIDAEHALLAYEDYYARGVGLVRSVTYNESEGSSQMLEQNLLRYAFPAPPE